MKKYKNKWLTELDIFSLNFKKPVVAITGTVGKTTVSHILAELLKYKNIKTLAAGNIGVGMCDLIEQQDHIDLIVLEVSSFQLELCKYFVPDLAIWTNFYPNHLDRHGTVESYFNAKLKTIVNQKSNQKSLINFDLYNQIKAKSQNNFNFFSLNKITKQELSNLTINDALFFIEDNYIKLINKNTCEIIFNLKLLPTITFNINWLIIISSLYLLNIELANIENLAKQIILPEHRLEKFATINNIEFYNDSKSTIPDATLAAVSKFNNKQVILFLGGLSKGVDRRSLIEQLKNKVKYIICFGAEAENLKNMSIENQIDAVSCLTLNDAVDLCFKLIHPNDIVLFSPSGSSFDLFTNYEERGKVFKQLVLNKVC